APNSAAVLPNMPAVRDRPAFASRVPEFIFRLAIASVFRREEAREVPTKDLAFLIAEDALGAGVPCGDTSFGVEHEDGVIRHILNQETCQAILPKSKFRPLIIRHVRVPRFSALSASQWVGDGYCPRSF